MNDPLDSPPLPKRGDQNPDTTQLGVGRIMSGWEWIELELSRVYSVFVGDPDGEAMRQYGIPTVSSFRLEGLAKVAEAYFVKAPSQRVEGEFIRLLGLTRKLLSRRNEVAHGVIFDISPITAFNEHFEPKAKGKKQHAIISPYYAFKQHNAEGLPAYAYTSPTLYALMAKMGEVHRQWDEFRARLVSP
jgi:hypothetical protein